MSAAGDGRTHQKTHFLSAVIMSSRARINHRTRRLSCFRYAGATSMQKYAAVPLTFRATCSCHARADNLKIKTTDLSCGRPPLWLALHWVIGGGEKCCVLRKPWLVRGSLPHPPPPPRKKMSRMSCLKGSKRRKLWAARSRPCAVVATPSRSERHLLGVAWTEGRK